MKHTKLLLASAMLLSVGVPAFAADERIPGSPTIPTQSESELIQVLQSDASRNEKADACRHLALVGTSKAVPALMALLANPELNHMARYGLESIPGDEVNAALREALGKTEGLQKVGVIGSLGMRKDREAIESLSALLNDKDADIAEAAARAIGKIGSRGASRALLQALDSGSATNRLAVSQALMNIAESQVKRDRTEPALRIYDRLMQEKAHQIRAGALRGSVIASGEEGIAKLLDALRGDDFSLAQAAALTAQELLNESVTKALAEELPKLSADKQIIVIQSLGFRGDKAAKPALEELAKGSDSDVAKAAKAALSALSD